MNQAETILAQEIEIKRLREALEFCASPESDHIYFTVSPLPPQTKGQVRARQVLKAQPTPTTGLLDVVKAVYIYRKGEDCECGFHYCDGFVVCDKCNDRAEKMDGYINALPPEVLKLIMEERP